jgi:hypothetical protein
MIIVTRHVAFNLDRCPIHRGQLGDHAAQGALCCNLCYLCD